MASITTQKRVNLWELDQSLGGHGLNASGDLDSTNSKTIETVPGSPVTAAQLQTAVDGYTYVAPPAPPSLSAIAVEVGQLTATIEATTTAQAPKPTPRTDALEAWRTVAEPKVNALGTAATKDTGTGATHVVLGNDARLTDARTPTSHTHPVAQVTGLHAVATSGDYAALVNKPTIPAAVAARRVIVNTGALTANTVKNVPVTWPSAMPDTNYAVTALIESITPQNVALGVNPGSKTTAGCTLSVRSTAAVAAAGLNVHVVGLA